MYDEKCGTTLLRRRRTIDIEDEATVTAALFATRIIRSQHSILIVPSTETMYLLRAWNKPQVTSQGYSDPSLAEDEFSLLVSAIFTMYIYYLPPKAP
ncbi:hypothetical protein BPOR_0156g00130 [Botrytis porri]|uniref:Uncharacterized protein n=1 Tax=Botrytis porri TaxID=87229 RepID=A0A4Z1KVS2_9HELO|nr:hypothetical protein BPOR_0156g00130 [Botrytis porri]